MCENVGSQDRMFLFVCPNPFVFSLGPIHTYSTEWVTFCIPKEALRSDASIQKSREVVHMLCDVSDFDHDH